MEGRLDNYSLLRIFSYLKLRDLGRLEQVSTRFRELALSSFSVYRNIDCRRDKITTSAHARTISEKVGPGLRRLIVSRYPEEPSFTLGILEAFLVNCPNIEHFEFNSIPVQELGMLQLLDAYVAQGDIKIKSVSFEGCHLDDRQDTMFFRHLERATNLEEVKINGSRLSNDMLHAEKFTGKWLKFLKNLKRIDLENCSSLQPSYFIEFCKRNKTLVNLKVWTGAMNQECVKTIAEELKNLQRITIDCKDFPDSANLAILGDLPKLEELEMWNLNQLAIPLLKRLAFHNKLRALKCFCPFLSPEEEEAEIFREMVKIQGLKSFEFFTFASSGFGDEYLKISTMDKLEELEICGSAVTNQGLFDFILRNPSLRILNLFNCQNVTDEFAQMIIPRLRTDFKSLKISAVGTKISEKNVRILFSYKEIVSFSPRLKCNII